MQIRSISLLIELVSDPYSINILRSLIKDSSSVYIECSPKRTLLKPNTPYHFFIINDHEYDTHYIYLSPNLLGIISYDQDDRFQYEIVAFIVEKMREEL